MNTNFIDDGSIRMRSVIAGCLMWGAFSVAHAGCYIANYYNGYSETVCSQPPAVWGAIAVSPSTVQAGSAWGYSSAQDADNQAVRQCSLAMNAMLDCRVIRTFANACVALATSPHERAWGFSGAHNNTRMAASVALRQCQSGGGQACTVVFKFCSPG